MSGCRLLFRRDNTDGYAAADLAALNAEWEARVLARGLEAGTDEYEREADRFADEVSGRS